MTKQVDIEALRPFNKTAQGDLCEIGETFPVDATRAAELERLGLAVRAGTEGKDGGPDPAGKTQAAPKPSNKAAPKPKTKG